MTVDNVDALRSFGLRQVAWLGNGQESVVYRARDHQQRDWVVKLFDTDSCTILNHGARVGSRRQPIGPTAHLLRRLSRRLHAPVAGLTPLRLLERDDQLLGLCYRFEPLAQLRRPLLYSAHVRRTYLSTFAATQAWLLRHAALATCEPQFLIAYDGTLRFIEYGPMLLSVTDPRCREDQYLSRTLLTLLTALYRPAAATACAWPQLHAAVAADTPAGAVLLDQIMTAPEAAFADAQFYHDLACSCRDRITPSLVLLARLLHQPRATRKTRR